MSALLDTQREFAALLNGEDRSPDGMIAQDSPGGFDRINVYRNNYTLSMRAALQAVYPVVEALVGESFFADLCRSYLQQFPCRSGNLHDFGDRFAAHVDEDPRLDGYAYLPDVARLEWCRHLAYHGADADVLDLTVLQQWSAEQIPELNFVMHPASRLLQSCFPVVSIWDMHQQPEITESLNIDAGGEQVLITRSGAQLDMHRIDVSDFVFLSSLRSGASLAQAAEATLEISPDFDLDARLSTFALSGFFTDVRPVRT